MEKLELNLSEQEFSRGKKILLWGFSGIFFLAGLGILFMKIVQQNPAIEISFALAPFGISIAVGIVAFLATFKPKDNYFLIDDEKIEYRTGMLKSIRTTHKWSDIKEIRMPHREKKVRLIYTDNTSHIINLLWLDKRKTHIIRKHIYTGGKEKNINISKVKTVYK